MTVTDDGLRLPPREILDDVRAAHAVAVSLAQLAEARRRLSHAQWLADAYLDDGTPNTAALAPGNTQPTWTPEFLERFAEVLERPTLEGRSLPVTVGWPCLTGEGSATRLRLRCTPVAPTPFQAAFCATTDPELLAGGAGGAGKSYAELIAALMFIDVPGYNALILRRSLLDLSMGGDSLIPISKAWLPAFGGKWNGSDNKWTFPQWGTTLQFGYLRDSRGVSAAARYRGPSFQYVAIDEMTELEDPADVLDLFGRVRRPTGFPSSESDGLNLAEVPLRLRGATNPGNAGHEWVKARYVDPATQTAPFLPGTYLDNPNLDAEYEQMLDRMTPGERLRIKFGSWASVEDKDALLSRSDIVHEEPPETPDVAVMFIDPSVGPGDGDEAGIVSGVAAGGRLWVVSDVSLQAHPDRWARVAITEAIRLGVSRIGYEANQGGEAIRSTLLRALDAVFDEMLAEDPDAERPRIQIVSRSAKKGETKAVRAGWAATHYRPRRRGAPPEVVHAPHLEQGRLETQWCNWVPGKSKFSPDRVDACAWLVREALTAGRASVTEVDMTR